MIWHLYVAWGGYRAGERAPNWTPAKSRSAVACPAAGAAEADPTAAYRCLPKPRRKRYRRTSGRDSDLEAFSHNPSDGSLAPLAYQPST